MDRRKENNFLPTMPCLFSALARINARNAAQPVARAMKGTLLVGVRLITPTCHVDDPCDVAVSIRPNRGCLHLMY